MMNHISSSADESSFVVLQPVQDIDGIEVCSPPAKRRAIEEEEVVVFEEDHMSSLKNILCGINKNLCERLDAIERKLDTVDQRLKYLEERVEPFCASPTDNSVNEGLSGVSNLRGSYSIARANTGAVALAMPQEQERKIDEMFVGAACSNNNIKIEKSCTSPQSEMSLAQSIGPNVTLITLNCEEDYPNGSWLGDESNPEIRVRVAIPPSDLLHIHSNCRTAEKMALALLDFLFDRDTQAMSNLSGMGKHGKKQLDPLLIYGIRCHLVHKFQINDEDWKRIKLNIDSKCRTAFRRKVRGMPLTVKAFRGKSMATYIQLSQNEINEHFEDLQTASEDDESYQQDESDLQLHQVSLQVGDVTRLVTMTSKQLEQLRQGHAQARLISNDQIAFHQDMNSQDGITLTMSPSEAIHILTTESGETMEISHNVLSDEISQADQSSTNEDD